MRRSGRWLHLSVGSVVTALSLGVGGLVLANTAAASATMTATTWVNMRSGPGTAHGVVHVLAAGESVTATGTVSGGWYELTTSDGYEGWTYESYLRASSGSTSPEPAPPSDSAPATTGQATTIAAVLGQ